MASPKPTHAEMVWRHIERQPDGCWHWTGMTLHGYGRVTRWNWSGQAHRVVYELLVEPIPEGMELDHLCRVRKCVNPLHLEVVTPAENARRAAAVARARPTCIKGHPRTPENIYLAPQGTKHCRECRRAAHRRWLQRRAA